MPHARFQSQIGSPVIDEENGVIRGCRIATLGAKSTSKDGEGAGLEMDSDTIGGLYSLSKDGIPAFFTHGWYDDDSDPLNNDTGVWKDTRIDNIGNLVADWHAFDTPHKAGIFSRAKVDPNSIAVSPIFDYDLRSGSTTLCNPTRFISADFVKAGAINKALFSDDTNKTEPMDITEFLTLLEDPKSLDAIEAIVKKARKSSDDSDSAAAAEMESDAGVTDADKKKDDDQKPALMRALPRCVRAINRIATASLKSIEERETAILAKAAVQSKAEATALLGSGKFLQTGADKKDGETATARFNNAVKELTERGVKSGVATQTVLREKKELHTAMLKELGVTK